MTKILGVRFSHTLAQLFHCRECGGWLGALSACAQSPGADIKSKRHNLYNDFLLALRAARALKRTEKSLPRGLPFLLSCGGMNVSPWELAIKVDVQGSHSERL